MRFQPCTCVAARRLHAIARASAALLASYLPAEGEAAMVKLVKKYVPDWLAIIVASKLVTSYFLLT
jgi:uncharacterized membrane protein YhaH (DUF805 family)